MSVLKFGTFELNLTERRISQFGKPFHLGKRALDLLTVLASRAGEVVSKEELVQLVWPTTTVEEGALRVHLVTLRKALADSTGRRYIENVPGRGYVFVAPVEMANLDSTTSTGALNKAQGILSRPSTRLVGREDFISSSLEALQSTRLLTIVGAGGIGKSAVALDMADRLNHSGSVMYFDLATFGDDSQLMPSVALALGLVALPDEYDKAVIAALKDRRALLFFDNCEHMIETVALASDFLIKSTTNTSILATSREPLRVAGERVRQLPSLPVPDGNVAVDELMAFPSVELFVESVRLVSDTEEFQDPSSLRSAAAIVRSLDGIPLAIELAASRVSDLGLASVAESVDAPLAILRRGRRTAPKRQQTLRATLDWSYSSLTADERLLLTVVAVFPGSFSDQSAETVASAWLSGERFDNAFDGLLLKSLLSVSRQDGRYRLLDTTRGYAVEKLGDSVRSRKARNAHADFVRQELMFAKSDWQDLSTREWLAKYGNILNDLRAALNWCFSETEHINLAVELTALSNVLWVQLGLMGEQLAAAERALDALPMSRHAGSAVELELRTVRASALYHVRGFKSDAQTFAEFDRAASIAESLGIQAQIIRANAGKISITSSNGYYAEAIAMGAALQERFPTATGLSRLLEHNHLFNGEFASARQQAKVSIGEVGATYRTTLNSGTGYDQGLIARSVVAMADFLEGRIDRSLKEVSEIVLDARQLGHSVSTCLVLCLTAVPIAYLAGDISGARARLQEADQVARKDMLIRWNEWVEGYMAVVPEEAQTEQGQATLQTALSQIAGLRLEYLTVLAGCRVSSSTLQRALSSGAGWCRPELLRLRSVTLMKSDRQAAVSLLNQAHELSERMGAALWELRSALCLFRIANANEKELSRYRLVTALNKFDCNHSLADIKMATSLLAK